MAETELPPWGGYYGFQIVAGVESNHDEAVRAWREGRLPTAEPPASPVFTIEGVF